MFHLDESADDHHHVHAGVLVDAADAAAASEDLDAIFETAVVDGVCGGTSELHATEMISGDGGWQGTLDERIDVIRQSLKVLAPHNIEVIAHGARLDAVQKRYGPSFKPHRWEFSNLLERVNERLRARGEYAVVIADNQDEYRDRLQRDVIDGRRHGTGGYRHQKLDRIVDTAHFVDSKLSRMTQLADLVSYVLRRRTSFPNESDPRGEAVSAELYAVVLDAVPSPKGQFWTVRY